MFSQSIADQHLRTLPEGANPGLSPQYYASPAALDMRGTGLVDNQKEPDLSTGLEPSRGKIWGMKRRTFVIALGILIIFVIALGAGVGGGVGAAVAKSNPHSGALESAKSNPQSSSTSTSISSSPSPTSSSDHATLVTVTSSTSSSPTPTPIGKNTPLVAVNWNTSNIQLLYKHADGSIRLQENSGLEWGEQSAQITKPKDDSGIAAVGWLGSDNSRQVRLYTIGQNNALKESSWNSTGKIWYDQDIPFALDPPAAGSSLTAYTWFIGQTRQIRVYYQGQDGYIREAAYDFSRGWIKSAAPTIQGFPRARNGTGLAIVSFPNTDESEAKLYYQNMDGKLMSYDYKGVKATFTESWQNQDPAVDHGSIPDGAHLTAIAPRFGDLTLRIYFTRDGKLVETWWSQKGGWQSWNMHDAAALGVSAVSYSDDIYVFFQDRTQYLSELSLNRVVNKWQFTAII